MTGADLLQKSPLSKNHLLIVVKLDSNLCSFSPTLIVVIVGRT